MKNVLIMFLAVLVLDLAYIHCFQGVSYAVYFRAPFQVYKFTNLSGIAS